MNECRVAERIWSKYGQLDRDLTECTFDASNHSLSLNIKNVLIEWNYHETIPTSLVFTNVFDKKLNVFDIGKQYVAKIWW